MKSLTYKVQKYFFPTLTNTIWQELSSITISKEDFITYTTSTKYIEQVARWVWLLDCDVGDVYTLQEEIKSITKLIKEKDIKQIIFEIE